MKKSSSRSNTSSPASRTWRTIEQKGGRKAVTDLGRKRKRKAYLKAVSAFLVVIFIISAVGFGVYFLKTKWTGINLTGTSEPIRVIHFETDGVLSREWFANAVPIARGTKLMDLDIHRMKDELESLGQIKDTIVSRQFPDELKVAIKERVPVLRARFSTAKGSKPEERLISREGVVYKGMEYAKVKLEQLPYLGGVRFSSGPEGIDPVEGLPVLNRLLTLSRTRYPDIYDDWKVVSFQKPDQYPGVGTMLITVKSRNVKEIVFSPPSFEWQLAELERIIEHSRRRGIRVIKKIDLSLGDQVVVQDFPDLRYKRTN